MVKTTITLSEDEFKELRRLAEQQERSVSWLLRRAFQFAKPYLERGGAPEPTAERLWEEIGALLERAGVASQDVGRMLAHARRRTRARKRDVNR